MFGDYTTSLVTSASRAKGGSPPWLLRALTDRHLRPVSTAEGLNVGVKWSFTPVGSEEGRGSNLFAHLNYITGNP